MKKKDLKTMYALIEWKMSMPTSIPKLKSIVEKTETGDVKSFAKELFYELGLEELFNKLKIEIPDFKDYSDFEDNENDNDEEEETLSEGMKMRKEMFKWL